MQFGFGFQLMKIIYLIAAAIVLGGIIAIAVKLIVRKRKNDRSPRISTDAEVLRKHKDASMHTQPVGGDITGAHGFQHTHSTTYYVRFRLQNGETPEFCVGQDDFAALHEGDRGVLTYQGTRYLGFTK